MSAVIETVGLDHIVLRVKNVERSVRWYKRVLGCEEERRVPDVGLHQLRLGNALIDVVDVNGKIGKAGGAAPGRKQRNVDHFAVQLRHFDEKELRVYLRRRGVKPGKVERRYGAAGHGPSMYVTDPDGNTVELKGPPDRDQTEKAASAIYPARRKRAASARRRPVAGTRKATGRKAGRRSAATSRGRKSAARAKSGLSGATARRRKPSAGKATGAAAKRTSASAAKRKKVAKPAKRRAASASKPKAKPKQTAKSAAKRKPAMKTTIKRGTRTTPKRRK
jgi:catechol 2,3-dioxygenase-like lactoylglutathione lyase family enzyme